MSSLIFIFIVGAIFFLWLLGQSGKAGENAALARAGLRFDKALVGDGNCFYRGFAHALWNAQDRYREVHEALAAYIESPETEWDPITNNDAASPTQLDRTRAGHAAHVRGSAWGGQVEAFLLAKRFSAAFDYVFIFDKWVGLSTPIPCSPVAFSLAPGSADLERVKAGTARGVVLLRSGAHFDLAKLWVCEHPGCNTLVAHTDGAAGFCGHHQPPRCARCAAYAIAESGCCAAHLPTARRAGK